MPARRAERCGGLFCLPVLGYGLRMPKLDKAILSIVSAAPGPVSIAGSIRRLREVVSTRSSDVELMTEIASIAAGQGKKILFDLKA